MNVLLVYPAPPPSAWPKGAFRSRWIPSGLACIATVLRRGGHQVKIHLCEETLELNQYDRSAARASLQAQMREFRPELVGLSLVTSGVPEGAIVAEDASVAGFANTGGGRRAASNRSPGRIIDRLSGH